MKRVPIFEKQTLIGVMGNKDYWLVILTPDEFLDLCPPLTEGDESEFRLSLIRKHTPWNAIPYLIIKDNKVVAMDGRHRALVLQEWGVPHMVVEIRNEWLEGLPRPLL